MIRPISEELGCRLDYIGRPTWLCSSVRSTPTVCRATGDQVGTITPDICLATQVCHTSICNANMAAQTKMAGGRVLFCSAESPSPTHPPSGPLV